MIKDIKYAKYYMDNELNGKIIKIDKGFTAITGYTWEDVKKNNMAIFDLVPIENREEYLKILYASVEAGEAYLNHDIMCKDGTVITVNCFGEVYKDNETGHDCSKILIIDVTAQEKAVEELNYMEEKAALQIEKIKFLTENAHETFLDYDIQRDYLEISRFIDGQYEIFYTVESYIGSINRTVYTEDFEGLKETLIAARNAEKKSVFDLRSKLFTGEYRWYRLVYARYINPKTGKTHVIGRIMDINDDKLASLSLKNDVEIDAFTGLYRPGTTELKINEIFDGSAVKSKHTMLLVDIDHMRAINSKYGHSMGDMIIKKISELLCQLFRQNFDIIGRVYGDVFVVFIRNTVEIIYIEERCSEICQRVRKQLSKELLKKENILTVSIGIATGDEKSGTYKRIYKKADKALARQKENGRDGFSF